MLTVSVTALMGLLICAGAQAQVASPSPAEPPPAITAEASGAFQRFPQPSTSATITFTPIEEASQHIQEMRERLADPAQRAAVRAEQLASVRQSNPELGPALGIDPATELALHELLADHQLEQLDEFHERVAQDAHSTAPTAWDEQLHAQAEQETRRIEELRALLGDEKLERFHEFHRTRGARMQVSKLETGLTASHRLTAEQKERLINLWHEHSTRVLIEHSAMHASPLDRLPSEPFASQADLQRQSELQMITMNEQVWRRMPAEDRALRNQAAEFLSATQLAALERMLTERTKHLQGWIEQARVQAGLSRDIPEHADAPPTAQPARTPVEGDVQIGIRLTVNRESPAVFTQMTRNGEPVTFTTVDGLRVEATPVLYDDGKYEVRLAYFEEGTSGKQLIGEMGQMGTHTPTRTGIADLEYAGAGGTVLTGRKGYAIEVSARVAPL